MAARRRPARFDPPVDLLVGAPILPHGMQVSVRVPFSRATLAAQRLVEWARMMEPALGLTLRECPRADHVPSGTPVDGNAGVFDDECRRVGY